MSMLRIGVKVVPLITAILLVQSTIHSQELLDVPGPESLVASEALVREVAKSLSASHEKGSKEYFAAMNELAASEADPARKFLILNQLLEESIENGKVDDSLEAIKTLGEAFRLAEYRLRIETISNLLADKKVVVDRTQCVGLLITAIREALGNRDFVVAKKGYSLCIREMPKDSKKQLTPCLSKLKRALEQYESMTTELVQIKKQLMADALDVSANAAMGRYCFLVEGDLDRCKTFFARSQNPKLEEIAALESAEVLEPENHRRLGDLWWEFSETQREEFRRLGQKRAASWYLKCIDKFKGLELALVKSRIAAASAIDLCQFAVHDLLSAKVNRRFVNGALDERRKVLVLSPSGPSSCEFNLSHSDEYDLEYKFIRRDGKWGIFFTFPTHRRAFGWHHGGHTTPKGWFTGFDELTHGEPSNQTLVNISENTMHSLLVKVRKDDFQCFLDGVKVSEVTDPFNSKRNSTLIDSKNAITEPKLAVSDFWGALEIISAKVTEYR